MALPVSMALALGYGEATFTGRSLGLTFPTMIALHGSPTPSGSDCVPCSAGGWAPPR
ncbi:MAG: hypothetical protein ABEH86_03470 [Haloarcula sp.]